jgi:hypothetical protein
MSDLCPQYEVTKPKAPSVRFGTSARTKPDPEWDEREPLNVTDEVVR